jgi:hypothetical protein
LQIFSRGFSFAALVTYWTYDCPALPDCWRELCRIAIAPMIAKVYSVVDIGANAKAMSKSSAER